MAVYVSEDRRQAMLDEGYMEVKAEPRWEKAGWLKFLNPELECCHPMRTGLCERSKDHKGKHTTVVFCCELCGRVVPGQPYRQGVYYLYGEIEDVFDYCFPCVKESQRSPYIYERID